MKSKFVIGLVAVVIGIATYGATRDAMEVVPPLVET
jgi:hypothetical protein